MFLCKIWKKSNEVDENLKLNTGDIGMCKSRWDTLWLNIISFKNENIIHVPSMYMNISNFVPTTLNHLISKILKIMLQGLNARTPKNFVRLSPNELL